MGPAGLLRRDSLPGIRVFAGDHGPMVYRSVVLAKYELRLLTQQRNCFPCLLLYPFDQICRH